MTQSSTTAAPAATDTTCPPWCDTNHDGRPWHFGARPVAVSNGATCGNLVDLYFCAGGGEPATVSIGDSDLVLSADQAHELGLALVRAGDVLRTYQAATR